MRSSPAAVPDQQVVMFVYNDAEHDSRVWRAAEALIRTRAAVTIIGRLGPGLPNTASRHGIRLVRVSGAAASGSHNQGEFRGGFVERIRWLLEYGRYYWLWRNAALCTARRLADSFAGTTVWHGHDLTGALVAVSASRRHGGPLVYDSHELFIEAGTAVRLPALLRRLLVWSERRIARRSDLIITVNESIAAELAQRYTVDKPTVVMNCPPAGPEPPSKLSSPLRAALSLDDQKVILYHGAASWGRIVPILEALPYIGPDVSLVVLGPLRGWGPDDVPHALTSRVRFHPPVPMAQLQAWVAGADVGLVVLRAAGLNEYYSTPNKLFECLNAGVPIVTSNFPELTRVVQQHEVGVVCDPEDPQALADAVNGLLTSGPDALAALRSRCRATGRGTYSWEVEGGKLLAAYSGLSPLSPRRYVVDD